MLEVLTNFICFIIMYGTGYLIVKKIVNKKITFSKELIFYITLLALVSVFLHQVQYTIIYTITVFLLNIVVFKKIFNIDWSQSIIATSIFMIALIPADVIINTLFRLIWTQDQIRADFFVSIAANAMIGIVSVGLISIPFINKITRLFYENISRKRIIAELVFFLLLVIGFCCLGYNYATHNLTDQTYISNVIIIGIFTIITIIFIQSKNDYKRLSDEYDVLYSYIQNFEEWIEKDQINRHEYKNQLAVLRALTKDKKVQNKIDEILEDSIKLKDEVIGKLKDLPKGGLKGLVYYKAALAQKKNINLTSDISLKKNTYLEKLSEPNNKVLCHLLGVYLDNAIEAAEETQEKYLLLEMYEMSDKVKIVISNSYIASSNFEKRNEKGVTTKGEGHGNGLYLASRILSKNKWIASSQKVVDNYYYQTLIIEKLDK